MPSVAYFPAYEIITGQYARGSYFGANLRDVTEAGVAHVMRLFLRHYGDEDTGDEDTLAATAADRHRQYSTQELIEAVCEEEALRRYDR
jgi:hypothetical protein